MFEHGVILKGSQTDKSLVALLIVFEHGVILKGSQTYPYPEKVDI